MELSIQTGALLLLIAAVVAMLTRRLRLPYSVGLVAAGIILASLPFAPRVILTKQVALSAGATDFLAKPFSINELLRRIEAALKS